MFGTRLMRARTPLLKKAKLIKRVGVVRSSCMSAKFCALACGSQKKGRGAPNMCAIVKYMRGTRKHRDAKKRTLSFLASSPKEFAFFCSACAGCALPSSTRAP